MTGRKSWEECGSYSRFEIARSWANWHRNQGWRVIIRYNPKTGLHTLMRRKP